MKKFTEILEDEYKITAAQILKAMTLTETIIDMALMISITLIMIYSIQMMFTTL